MTLRKYFTIIFISFSICVSFISGCSSEQLPAQEEAREYVINKRTGKIHDPSCSSVSLMSEKNKLFVSDTLLNLLKQDYVICRRCRAGIKKSGTGETLDRLLHGNLYADDVKITASCEDYLRAIDEMGEWYVNHVPTYASGIQTEPFSKYNGDLQNYKKYELKNKGKSSTYLVLSSDADSPGTSHLKADTQVLRGTENAASNYQDCFDQIDFEQKIAYYPCDLLSQVSDYNKPGDDCVRYLFAVFNMMDSQFTHKYSQLTGSSYSRTNSAKIATDYKDIAYGFINLGFKIYDTEERIIDVNNDTYAEGYVFGIDDDFVLQKGDILAREGHVHIYLGNGITAEADNFGWGQGVQVIPPDL